MKDFSICEALKSLLIQEGDNTPAEKALKAAGSGASGVSDLAERHDAYLVEPHAH